MPSSEDYLKKEYALSDERIRKIWAAYKEDIQWWTEKFNALYGNFFNGDEALQDEQLSLNADNYGVRIRNMLEAHQHGWIDPGNFFLLLNSVAESTVDNDAKRESLILELLGNREEKKNITFFGVPSRSQMPALIKELNYGADQRGALNQAPESSPSVAQLRGICTAAKGNNNGENDIYERVTNAISENGVRFSSHLNGISTILFYMNPERFIPVNSRTASIFNEDTTSAKSYINLCKQIWEHQESLRNDGQYGDLMLFPIISAHYLCGENQVATMLEDFKNTKNIILTGAPGTGKTYAVREYLKRKLGEDYNERVCWMQFHPNIEYADFIEGFRPTGAENGTIRLEMKNGVFKDFCKKGFANADKEYYFVIDEINRANLSAVFGEVLYAIEYRADAETPDLKDFLDTPHTAFIANLSEGKRKDLSVCPKNGFYGKFAVPDNLFIIGTMNDVDRSIDSFDLALRRRFVWVEMGFDELPLRTIEGVKNPKELIRRAKALNDELVKCFNGDKSYAIGHAYFMKIRLYKEHEDPYAALWNYHLKPLIREYLRSELDPAELDKQLMILEKEKFLTDN